MRKTILPITQVYAKADRGTEAYIGIFATTAYSRQEVEDLICRDHENGYAYQAVLAFRRSLRVDEFASRLDYSADPFAEVPA